jgi:choline kinase
MPITKSVVLSCAGIGSRLGLSKTKALMLIGEKTLIAHQLELFKEVEDLRIVIGYQASEVIKEVLKYRKDVIFVYNHDYFNTKTGFSFYLGAKDANNYVIEWDGDLLVHPDDVKKILESSEEFIGYADIMSDDAVFCSLNDRGEVIGFSRERGNFEWTGPACIHKDKIHHYKEHVFNILEEHLPMPGLKVRACDIDTYDDYLRAVEFMKGWDKDIIRCDNIFIPPPGVLISGILWYEKCIIDCCGRRNQIAA